MEPTNELINLISKSLETDNFVKVTLSKPSRPSLELKNVYVRQVMIKKEPQLSFTFRYKTRDEVKNYNYDEGKRELKALIGSEFRIATLFTLENDISLKISKKGKGNLQTTAPTFSEKIPLAHDREKIKRSDNASWMYHLGITDENGSVIPKMADKHRQINKFLEIMDSLIERANLPDKTLHIVDMGSGKGYLTFALYDYLVHQKGLNVTMTGIELREELVKICTTTAQKCGFDTLNFIAQPIEDYRPPSGIDILIALHACDTATDDALYKGIMSESALVVCAPCCHKQIRQQLKGKEQHSPILKYGIYKERQFEMVTDTLRALIMEQQGYETNIFEFVSNEHTRKNIMLTATRSEKSHPASKDKIEALKDEFGIEYHYLEKKLEQNS